MGTNLQFPLINSVSQPLTGSKATLQLFVTSSTIQSTFPTSVYSDGGGTASFYNVLPGIYSFIWTNAGAVSSSTYTNQGTNEVYLNIPDTSGSLVTNGFIYLYTGSLAPIPESGSAQVGSEYDLGIDIVSMTNNINRIVNDWALFYGGISNVYKVGMDNAQWGYDNTVGPKCLVEYKGENTYGDESVSHLTGYVIRDFDIIVERMETDTEPRSIDLVTTVGAAVPFLTLAGELRNLVRSILLPEPACYNPVIYRGMTMERKDEEMRNKAIISIQIICQIPRIQFYPPQLTNGQTPTYVNLIGL
jgi:hypothetical protein